MYFTDEMTPEDEDNEYLRTRPARELGMWQEWVLVVCERRQMPAPTGAEWDALTRGWHHGKMPVASADELERMRAKTPNVELSGSDRTRAMSARTPG